MSITKCPGHMRSLKLNFSATVLTLDLKAKIFENLRLCQAKFWGELRTRATFDRCGHSGKMTAHDQGRLSDFRARRNGRHNISIETNRVKMAAI